MTKISIIKILLIFFTFFAILFLIIILKTPMHSYVITNNPIQENTQLITNTGAFLQLSAIICLIMAMHYFLRYGYFNTKSVAMLKATAYIMAASEGIDLLMQLILNYIPGWKEWTQLPLGIFGMLPELLISLGILAVADFIQHGIRLENENNLII